MPECLDFSGLSTQDRALDPRPTRRLLLTALLQDMSDVQKRDYSRKRTCPKCLKYFPSVFRCKYHAKRCTETIPACVKLLANNCDKLKRLDLSCTKIASEGEVYCTGRLFNDIFRSFELLTNRKYLSIFPEVDVRVMATDSPQRKLICLDLRTAMLIKVEFEIVKLELRSTLSELTARVAVQQYLSQL